MGLTRTRFSQADTAVAKIQDPITVLNSGSTIANVDVGFLINRNQGTKSNVAVYWNEAGTELTVGLTANTGVPNGNIALTSYANLRAGTIYGNIGGGNNQANVYLTGSIIPTSNVAYDLGTSTNRFRSLWLSGSTLFMGSESLSVSQAGNWSFTTSGGTVQLGNSTILSDVTIIGNLNLQGNTTQFDSNNLIVHDSIIQLHTPANLAPLTGDDGRDIGIDFHYYKTQDNHAFLGWSNSTGNLEWYDSGYETASNVFVGNTYGAIKTGVLVLATSTTSTSTTTGALRVSGGAGIAGNVYVGTNLVVGSIDIVSNLVTAATNINSLSQASTAQDANLGTVTTSISTINANVTAANASIQAISANVGAYETYANTRIQTLDANVGAYETYANTRIQTLDANIGSLTNNLSNYSTVANAAAQQVQLDNIVSTANANALAYLTTTSATVVAATNTTRTQVTSNVSGGTAYVTFVSATTGNVEQNINTALTYDPNSGNLTAYGLITTTGLYWANGSPFVSSSYGNTEVAAYLPINSTITGIQANIGAYQSYANSNAATQTTSIDSVNANIGAYQTYANSNAATQATSINSIDANVGAYQTYANANIGGLAISINSINSNVSAANSAIQTLSANIGTLVAGAPGALDTLLELGNALGNSDSFSSTMVNWLSNITSNVTAANSSINAFNANLGAYQTYANANASTQATSIDTFNANLGAFQIFSNTNAATQATSINSIDANVGAYEIYANANIGTISTSLQTLNANVGAYQTYANANAATQTTSINSIDANVGAYQTYANANLGTATTNITTLFGNAATQTTSINTVNANIGAYQTWANTSIVSLYTNANANTAAYLTTYTGNIQAGNISVTGNVNVTSNVFANKLYTTNGLYWAGNGVAFSSGGYTAGVAPPVSGNISGDQWYYTSTDVLYEYVNDGTTSYWVDIQSQTIAATTTPPVDTADTLHPFLLAGM